MSAQKSQSKSSISYSLLFKDGVNQSASFSDTYVKYESDEGTVPYVIITAMSEDEDDKYFLKITRKYVDDISDIMVKTMIKTKPGIIAKLFSNAYQPVSTIEDDKLVCIIDAGLLAFQFVLEKEIIDENTMLRKQLAKLSKRIEELEDEKAALEDSVYMDMPEWSSIENRVEKLYKQHDPEYQKFYREQVSTTNQEIIKKYFGAMNPLQKYQCWLTLIYNTGDHMSLVSAQAWFVACGQFLHANPKFILSRFKSNKTPSSFRKFFVTDNNPEKNCTIMLKTIASSNCGCNHHFINYSTIVCLSYIDIN